MEDESRLKTFSAQIAIALENAKLFADVQNMQNYKESMLESMSSGALTLDENEKIVTCNASGLRILHAGPSDIINRSAHEFFAAANSWVLDQLKRVEETQALDLTMDPEMELGGELRSVNVTVMPLISSGS